MEQRGYFVMGCRGLESITAWMQAAGMAAEVESKKITTSSHAHSGSQTGNGQTL